MTTKGIIYSFLSQTARLWPDKQYLKMLFWLNMGRKLDLKDPKSYTEKLQWLKLYYRQPELTMMVDKVKVKSYVSSILGEEYIIPTLGVWKDPDEIDFEALPDRFVLKCNHNSSHGIYICRDKSKMDAEQVKRMLKEALKEDFYINTREWPYKNVPRRIIAEEYLDPSPNDLHIVRPDLKDYKFFCFNGKVKVLFISTDRWKGDDALRFDFFDEHFNHLPFTNGHPNADIMPEKPKQFDEMVILAEKLSTGIPHVRIDFYNVNGRVYFGEMTFFHFSGMVPFNPEEWDNILGGWLELPSVKVKANHFTTI